MRRNTASQTIGCQMVSAADGSAFTGAVTVAVTGDAGTQATGSVGAGACTHEGNGFHTYVPAQAETNYAHVAFTFTGSGAIPATIQIYTRAYDASGRATADLTHIAGAAVSTSTAQLGVNAVQAGGTAWGSGAITAASIATDAFTAAKIATDFGTEVATAVWASGTRLLTAGTNIALAKGTGVTGFTDLDAAGVRSAVGLASANLDTQIGTLATAANLATVAGYLDTEIAALTTNLATANTNINTIDDLLDTEIAALTTNLATANANIVTIDTVVDAVKVKTDQLAFTKANEIDANIQSINGVTITGDGQTGTEFSV